MNFEQKFDPEIKVIESDLIETLLKFPIFYIRGEITSKILFYFITRKDLTQYELQNLTGFSAGKISQELNNLLEFNLIEISKRSKPWIYTMESVVAETFSRAIALLKSNIKWETKFLEIKGELEENEEELQKLNGFDEVRDFIEANLMRFSGFKRIIKLWEELKKKYEKESL
jgi:DNA-binding transcriptional regulator GbsR (MarR family)